MLLDLGTQRQERLLFFDIKIGPQVEFPETVLSILSTISSFDDERRGKTFITANG